MLVKFVETLANYMDAVFNGEGSLIVDLDFEP